MNTGTAAVAIAGLALVVVAAFVLGVRRGVAADQQRRRDVRSRADQQNAWAARGDLRGVYGTEGAALMRSMPPANAKPIRPPGEALEVATVVTTEADLAALLRARLPCWRYAAFVSVLVQRRAEVQARLRDALMGFSEPEGPGLRTGVETGLFFTERLTDLSDLVEKVDAFMLSPAFQDAFGDPHDENSADADGIVHAANRLMDYHGRLLSLAERCRSVDVPWDCRELQRDTAMLMALPLEGFDSFIDTFVARLDEMADVARYATGDVQLDPVELGIHDDDGLVTQVSQRLQEISRTA